LFLKFVLGLKRIFLVDLSSFVLRLKFFRIILRFFLDSRFVLFLRLFKSGVLLFLVIAPDEPSCYIFYNCAIVLLSLFFFLKVILHYFSIIEFLLLSIRPTLSFLNWRYRLGFVEIFCRVFRFLVIVVLEIDER
jgi:hypothetical protein